MIPAAFDYVRAGSPAEAIDLLQRDPEGTKLVAGADNTNTEPMI
jgi:aerobic carbon-monoxide dehydrogenase medium subunit